MSEKKLTKREVLFIESYIRCFNAAAAAREAGYSKKTAKQIGYELLTKPYLKDAVNKRLKEIRMETDEIYARLTAQAQANLSDIVEPYEVPIIDKEGSEIGSRQEFRVKEGAFEKYGFLIKSIVPTSSGAYRIELYSAQTALELMGKTYSLFVDRDEKGKPLQPIVNIYIPQNDRDNTT